MIIHRKETGVDITGLSDKEFGLLGMALENLRSSKEPFTEEALGLVSSMYWDFIVTLDDLEG